MPLHDLVEYFNDRFGREHHSSFRPFILKDKKVRGLFGPIRIDSLFSPIRHTVKPTDIIGHAAQIEVSTHATQYLCEDEIENLLANNEKQPTSLESIINFDRLSRTVHMLNFLTVLPSHGSLFLEVDPRHILGIKHDHGVYFGEVIAQCGLNTQYIVIVLSVHSQYARHYRQLLAGLDNYRHQGYQIALKFDYRARDKTTLDLIASLSPNYVSVSAEGLGHSDDSDNLDELTTVVASVNGQSILQQVDQKKTDSLARSANFDLVEGSYYRAIAFDYLGKPKTTGHPLEANHF
ncbi:hypothetical protein [Methyloglobulus sp.]|uniref:hypothetical protein n=1 Tax=Methyloglobulus sp. TaxID=2518622 RepID=UPI00398A10DB